MHNKEVNNYNGRKKYIYQLFKVISNRSINLSVYRLLLLSV